MITCKMKRRIKRELSAERPSVLVGKEAITPQIVDEINRRLKKREMLKVKILRSALKEKEARDVAAEIARKTESVLIDVKGHTFMLYKRRRRK